MHLEILYFPNMKNAVSPADSQRLSYQSRNPTRHHKNSLAQCMLWYTLRGNPDPTIKKKKEKSRNGRRRYNIGSVRLNSPTAFVLKGIKSTIHLYLIFRVFHLFISNPSAASSPAAKKKKGHHHSEGPVSSSEKLGINFIPISCKKMPCGIPLG